MQLRKKTIDITNSDQAENFTQDYQETPFKLNKELRLNQLENSLQELKEDQKIGITLFYLEGLSYQQIANQTGWELKKVKSEIQNGKRNLKIKVKEQI